MRPNRMTRLLSFVLSVLLISALVPFSAFNTEADAAGEQYAILPLRVVHISQPANGSFSHKGTKNVDFDLSQKLYAPFDCTVVEKATSQAAGNRIIVQSKNKVHYANGDYDYMTVLTCHDNDISDLYVGKSLSQGQYYYHTGTYGYVTGEHTHVCVAKGKYAGQYKNSYGNWELKNSILPSEALYLHESAVVKYGAGYNWRRLTQVKPDTPKISSNVSGDVALNTPVTVSWNTAASATEYLVYINGSLAKTVTGTSYSFKASEAKKYEACVCAKNANSKLTSGQSNKISVTAHAPVSVTFVNWDDTPVTKEPLTVS